MAVETVADFAAMLAQIHLVEPAQLKKIATQLQSRFPEPRAGGGTDSPQLDDALPGQPTFPGPVPNCFWILRVLNRLGEGGMGEVYKALNWKLKIVALKLIRKDAITPGPLVVSSARFAPPPS